MAGPWEKYASAQQPEGPIVTPLPMSPRDAAKEGRDIDAAGRDEVRTGIAVRGEGREIQNNTFSHITKLANDYNSDPSVKAYRTAIGQFAQALNTGVGAQGDLALTYAFAKAMDPESVVREAEQGMVTQSQPWFQALVEKTKKQFGMDGAGNYTPETREALRKQISNAVAQRAKVYDARRNYYEQQAGVLGLDPSVIIGQHDAAPFVPAIRDWVGRVNAPKQEDGGLTVGADDDLDGQELLGYNRDGAPIYGFRNPDGRNPLEGDPNYTQSPLAQGLYGVNDGIASTLGLPVDLMTAGMNLVPQGINAIANTDIPQIENPIGGGDWFKDKFRDAGFVGPDAKTGTGQFVRRAAESLGASALPVGATARTLQQTAIPLMSAIGGGIGAATAEKAFPNNPMAELGGELLGSGLTGAGLLKGAQRSAQRRLDETIPTVGDLKETAGDLYRKAETNGVTASPELTRQLLDDVRATLRKEGQLGPKGKITDADTSASKALNLLEQYAEQPMRPTEMETIRRVISDGRKSLEPSDRRISSLLLEQFDDFARPLAPEFDQARSVASRYLQAEDLEQARDLAGARAGQFTGSGYENALRTEYRSLDRANIKGQNHFDEPVVGAIRDVARGTPMSNAARALGRFAARGPVSAGLGVGGPAMLGAAVGGPAGAITMGGGAFALGEAGRALATKMGTRSAEVAELTARNGGPIPLAKFLPSDLERVLGAALLGQLGAQTDVNGQGSQDPRGQAQPDALARTVRRPSSQARGLFGAPR